MAYSYYQQAQPSWGTNQFQFGPPPPVSFQPLPTWGGNDFYRAHAANADPYLFDHAWNRVREYGGAPAGGMGVGLHEARHWHRRAYGANEISYMSPDEIGHAAAYEAYRTWLHNSHLYEHIRGDIEREREALTGLAVAEATRLLGFSARYADQYARLAATEAAAHTASYIFYQTRDDDYRSRSRYRTGMDDPYVHDDEIMYPRNGRSMSRHGRSLSRPRSYSRSRMAFPTGYGAPVSPTPQTAFAGSYAGSYASSPNLPMHSTPYPSAVPLSGSVYGSSGGSVYGASPQYPSMPVGISPSYQGSTLGVPLSHSRSRSASFSYPQQYPQYPQQQYPAPYMGTAMSSQSVGMPVGVPTSQTIVIHKPKKKHRHHSSRHSRSSDGEYEDHRSMY